MKKCNYNFTAHNGECSILTQILFDVLQDVSRLVDLCRQCILFDDAADIAACLRAIQRDPEAKIQRIKNRLDLAFDASKSGGYRDVVLNLVLSNEQTAAMGVDRHVCEVQLIHRKFAELKVSLLAGCCFF
jgi:hypothetical protein